jgi:uncharacterized protein (UPF0276 family)
VEFAVNYSPEAAALLAEGRIEIDRFKCPDWPHLIAEAVEVRPVYVHFPLITDEARLAKVDWAEVERLFVSTQTPFINMHMMAPAEGHPSEAVEGMIRAVRSVTARFGAEHVILENVPYYGAIGDILGNRFMSVCVEPVTINRILNETGCGLLFDLSHARISASYLNRDARDYITALPLDRMRELHITGLGPVGERMVDHMPITDADWPLIEWVFDAIRRGLWSTPRTVALEYGGVALPQPWSSEKSVIETDVPRLFDLAHGVPVG